MLGEREVLLVAGVVPFASSLRSMYGENAEIGSLSDVTIGIIEFMGIVTGPIRRGDGITPAVALVDPKFPHNVGAAKRVHDGLELPHSTAGDFDEPDHMADAVGVTWGG
jgi:hypothetical protein